MTGTCHCGELALQARERSSSSRAWASAGQTTRSGTDPHTCRTLRNSSPVGRGRCRPAPKRRDPRGWTPGPLPGEKGKALRRSRGPSGVGTRTALGSAPHRPGLDPAPPWARPTPRSSLPFWERIASPVLRSPNTDKGPSIFAAGYTSSFSLTADNQCLGPKAWWRPQRRRRLRRGTGPSEAAGTAGNTAPPARPRGRAGRTEEVVGEASRAEEQEVRCRERADSAFSPN